MAAFSHRLGWLPIALPFRATLDRAHGYAEQFGQSFVTPEHVLLAILSSTSGGSFVVRLGADGEALRSALEGALRVSEPADPPVPADAIDASTALSEVLDMAARIGQQLGVAEVDAGLVIVALVSKPSTLAGRLLLQSGITMEAAVALAKGPAVRTAMLAPERATDAASDQSHAAYRPMPAPPRQGAPEEQTAAPSAPRRDVRSYDQGPVATGWAPIESRGTDSYAEAYRGVEQSLSYGAPDYPAPGYPSQHHDHRGYAGQDYPCHDYADQGYSGRSGDSRHDAMFHEPEAAGTGALESLPISPSLPSQPRNAEPRGSEPRVAEPGAARTTPPPIPMSRARSKPMDDLPVQPMVDTGKLAESIPRRMRTGRPETVEVRIARGDATGFTQGMDGADLHVHTIYVTSAMTVQLKAPSGGFTIESMAPETQWIDNTLGLVGGHDFGSWRWVVTPTRAGKGKLQLVASVRSIDAQGMAAAQPLPHQIIEVKVRVNYGAVMGRAFSWVLIAMVGGALARYGERAVALAEPYIALLSRL